MALNMVWMLWEAGLGFSTFSFAPGSEAGDPGASLRSGPRNRHSCSWHLLHRDVSSESNIRQSHVKGQKSRVGMERLSHQERLAHRAKVYSLCAPDSDCPGFQEPVDARD